VHLRNGVIFWWPVLPVHRWQC